MAGQESPDLPMLPLTAANPYSDIGRSDDEDDTLTSYHQIRRKSIPVTAVREVATEVSLPSRNIQFPRTEQQLLTLHPWRVEICAWALSLFAVIAIIIILYRYDTEPLPRLPFSVSINSVISVFTVILKAALLSVITPGLGQLMWIWYERDRALSDIVMYDLASRGPLGSTVLLFHVHYHHVLASFGAILTIILVIMDPVTQQLMRYTDCSRPFNVGNATIPRTNYFSGPLRSLIGTDAVPPESQAAFNAGIFAPGASLTSVCPTGNCTFTQNYTTVGFCSSCTDLSDVIKVEVSDYVYNTTLPSGTFVSWSKTSTHLATLNFSYYRSNDTMPMSSNVIEFLVGKNPLMDVTNSDDPTDSDGMRLLDACKQVSSDRRWQCSKIGAAACTLYPCVRTYTGRIQAGVLQENLTEVQTKFGRGVVDRNRNDTINYGMLNMSCVTGLERAALARDGYNVTGQWLAYNITAFNVSMPAPVNSAYPQSLSSRGCLYALSADFVRRLLAVYVQQSLPGVIYGNFSGDESHMAALKFITGPQHIQNIYNFGNVSFQRVNQTFANISESLTSYIRQNGNEFHSEPAKGQVYHYAVCMKVQWGWITFPATLVLLTFLFMMLLILSVDQHQSPIWKTSPLALVFRGPFVGPGAGSASPRLSPRKGSTAGRSSTDESSDLLDKVTRTRSREEAGMEKSAKTIRIRLDRNSAMLRVDPSSPRLR